jgi:hypothetical protein
MLAINFLLIGDSNLHLFACKLGSATVNSVTLHLPSPQSRWWLTVLTALPGWSASHAVCGTCEVHMVTVAFGRQALVQHTPVIFVMELLAARRQVPMLLQSAR